MKTRSTPRVVTSVVPPSSMRARSTRPHGSVQRTGSPRLSHIWRRTSYHPCRSTGGPGPGVSSRSSTPGFIDARLTIRLSGGTSPRPLSTPARTTSDTEPDHEPCCSDDEGEHLSAEHRAAPEQKASRHECRDREGRHHFHPQDQATPLATLRPLPLYRTVIVVSTAEPIANAGHQAPP